MSRASHKRRWRTHTVVGIGEVQSSRPVIWKYDFELENWFGKAESAEPGSTSVSRAESVAAPLGSRAWMRSINVLSPGRR